MHISASQLREVSVHRFVADASDLRLPPVKFPGSFTTDAGNGRPCYIHRKTEEAFEYMQEFGCIVVSIIND